MDLKLHKTLDIRLKDVKNYEEAENKVDQILNNLKEEILEEVKDALTEEGDEC